MPPTLALVLTVLFIAVLFTREFKRDFIPSAGIAVPCIYLLIQGSRSVTEWVNLGTHVRGGDIAEGSPLDRTVFLILIVVGLLVLFRRGVVWSRIFRENLWLALFFFYCGTSLIWSDSPDIAFKRWTKALGDPLMALVILTDREPIKAMQFVLKTCVYVLIPLSILFIKYYPHLGRTFSEWTGAASNTGVTTNKNLLGFVLLVSGLFLVWIVLEKWKADKNEGSRLDNVGIPLLLLGMVGWLFTQADSKTSLVGFLVGSCLLLASNLRAIRAYIGVFLLAGMITFAVLQATVDIYSVVLQQAGRDSTLTGRTELWDVLLHMDPKPLFGHGFESFWLGERLKYLHQMYYFHPNQAHNGYIEVYLNLGLVGLCLLTGLLLSGFFKIKSQLNVVRHQNQIGSFSQFGIAFFVTYVLYNYTEAAFKSLHFLFIIFLICTINVPLYRKRKAWSAQHDFLQTTEGMRGNAGIYLREQAK